MKKIKFLFIPFIVLFCLSTSGQNVKVDVKTFVTRIYIHGIPYDEAKQYGKAAVPELLKMLKDENFNQYWPNVIIVLGFIGDPSAVTSLRDFMETSSGEISISRFRAILRVFQALGHIAQSGDNESLKILQEYTDINSWQSKKLKYRYNQYSNGALSDVLARQAIAGLGISGRQEGMKKLNELKQKNETKNDWQDNLDEAINLNSRVKVQGPKKVFGSTPK